MSLQRPKRDGANKGVGAHKKTERTKQRARNNLRDWSCVRRRAAGGPLPRRSMGASVFLVAEFSFFKSGSYFRPVPEWPK